MTLILDGTNGLSDIDGSAATPAIRGTDANTGIFFPAADTIAFSEGGVEAARFDSSGNLGIGTSSPSQKLSVVAGSGLSAYVEVQSTGFTSTLFGQNNAGDAYVYNGYAGNIRLFTGATERARIDSSGNLLVGTTSQFVSEKLSVITGNTVGIGVKTTGGSSNATVGCWNATTSGDSNFIFFATETSITVRGSITYNRAAGLTSYNITSDYRAKDITGPVTSSGALIDSVPVYMGTMKGATQERPMFLAHEVPAYARTGEKDAVDADGNPVYQQMDASALIPVMWAEIQSLRQRITALEGAQA